jgi:hypothetical protein
MPAPTLTPGEAQTDYGICVSQIDINDAGNVIHRETAYSLEDHVDSRGISQGNVRRAWAIVAGRVRAGTEGDTAASVTSESEGDYSYTIDAGTASAQSLNFLAGRPNQLLDIGVGFRSFSEHGQRRADAAWSGNGVPPAYDDFGVPFT